MKSVIASVVVAVLAGLVDAKASFTNTDYTVTKGQSFTLAWSGGVGPYTVNLKSGSSTNLKTVEALTSGSTAESLTWTPDSTLTTGTYAFEIIDASDSVSNYSPQFSYTGVAASGTTASTASATSSVSVTSSSSKSATTASSITSSASSSKASSSSASSSSVSSTLSSSSVSSNSTTTESTTLKTSSTASASKASTTSAAVVTTTSSPNTNGAHGFVAPIMGVIAVAAAVLVL